MAAKRTYYYCLTADTEGYVIDITCAGKDGYYYARMDSQEMPIRQMVVDEAGYAVREWTGEAGKFDPADSAVLFGGCPSSRDGGRGGCAALPNQHAHRYGNAAPAPNRRG